MTFPAGLLLAGLLTGAWVEPAGIELRDQYGGSDRVSAHRGEVVVVMVVTARRLRNLKGWERDLRERYDDLRFLRVADFPEDPPLTYGEVAAKLSNRVPDGIEVLIDLDRVWARELGLDTARPNVLLFDTEGRLVARDRGLADPEIVERFAAEIEAKLGAP